MPTFEALSIKIAVLSPIFKYIESLEPLLSELAVINTVPGLYIEPTDMELFDVRILPSSKTIPLPNPLSLIFPATFNLSCDDDKVPMPTFELPSTYMAGDVSLADGDIITVDLYTLKYESSK